MSYDPNGCSHGVKWGETCGQCEKIILKQNIFDLSQDCKAVAEALSNQPMMCTSPEVIIDLYRTIDRLASILLRINHD